MDQGPFTGLFFKKSTWCLHWAKGAVLHQSRNNSKSCVALWYSKYELFAIPRLNGHVFWQFNTVSGNVAIILIHRLSAWSNQVQMLLFFFIFLFFWEGSLRSRWKYSVPRYCFIEIKEWKTLVQPNDRVMIHRGDMSRHQKRFLSCLCRGSSSFPMSVSA